MVLSVEQTVHTQRANTIKNASNSDRARRDLSLTDACFEISRNHFCDQPNSATQGTRDITSTVATEKKLTGFAYMHACVYGFLSRI